MTEAERTAIALLEERIAQLIKRLDNIPEIVASQSTEITTLRNEVNTLFNRAWGLLAGIVLALFGAVLALLRK